MVFLVTYSSYGCLGETLILSCSNNNTINVVGAEYRQRTFPCNQPDVTCCPVQMENACAERLEDSAPQDLAALKVICDGQESCNFVNQGGYLASCPEPERVDTMSVWYDCLPGTQHFN